MFYPEGAVVTVAAGETKTGDLGHYGNGFTSLDLFVSGDVEAGANVAVSFQVSVDSLTWYDAKAVDLQGTSLTALVAGSIHTSDFSLALLRLTAFAPYVRINVDNSAGVAGAVITAKSVAVVD
jgi:hypothetical protein